jgi:hypothetical protein
MNGAGATCPREGKPIGPPESAIREAIRRELGRRQITRYELWKRARVHCPTLPNPPSLSSSAVSGRSVWSTSRHSSLRSTSSCVGAMRQRPTRADRQHSFGVTSLVQERGQYLANSRNQGEREATEHHVRGEKAWKPAPLFGVDAECDSRRRLHYFLFAVRATADRVIVAMPRSTGCIGALPRGPGSRCLRGMHLPGMIR